MEGWTIRQMLMNSIAPILHFGGTNQYEDIILPAYEFPL